MSMLKDSSELQEALGLFRALLDDQGPVFVGGPSEPPGGNLRAGAEFVCSVAPLSPGADPFPAQISSPDKAVSKPVALSSAEFEPVEGEFRGDRLENVLIAMCRRGGFSGAVLSDSSGLPMAVFNSPVEIESVAAFTSVLGDALDKAGRYLQQHGADYISMDVNYEDKVVVRRFAIAEMNLYLMVLCPQSVDERSEVELSIQQLVSVLG